MNSLDRDFFVRLERAATYEGMHEADTILQIIYLIISLLCTALTTQLVLLVKMRFHSNIRFIEKIACAVIVVPTFLLIRLITFWVVKKTFGPLVVVIWRALGGDTTDVETGGFQ